MPQDASNDRRYHPRESLLLPLQVCGEGLQRNWLTASLLDACPTGLQLCLPENLTVGVNKPVNLRFLFSDDNHLDIGSGTICHVEQRDKGKVLGIRLQEEKPFFSRVKMLGVSTKIQEIKALLPQISSSGLNVLIRGETGTGKNILAKLIHDARCGEERPFIRVNCPSIPDSLFESELFGHEKGAFTDAKSAAPGYFRLAQGGTILLDEISEISPHLQAKLLSVIEDKQFVPVGGQKLIPVTAGIIATTNLDLEKAVEEGRFRRDLYYRLSELPIELPALRERRVDIPLLANHFLCLYSQKYQQPLRMLSNGEFELLKNHSWPGNIRELENYLKQTALLGNFVGPGETGGQARPAVADEIGSQLDTLLAKGHSLPEMVKQMTVFLERILILQTLNECCQNRTRAAQQLGISYRTLLRKLEQLH